MRALLAERVPAGTGPGQQTQHPGWSHADARAKETEEAARSDLQMCLELAFLVLKVLQLAGDAGVGCVQQ